MTYENVSFLQKRLISNSAESFSFQAGARIFKELEWLISQQSSPCIALAGGSTPKETYHQLAMLISKKNQSFQSCNWFQTDERDVLPEHPDSNQRMILEALFKESGLSPDKFFRVPLNLARPFEITQKYENLIRTTVFNGSKTLIPKFDLVLLGIGEDGHIASLFPGCDLGREDQSKIFSWFRVDHLAMNRYSISFSTLVEAKKVIILATGSRKARILQKIFSENTDLPANHLRLARPIEWWVDPPAAAHLNEEFQAL